MEAELLDVTAHIVALLHRIQLAADDDGGGGVAAGASPREGEAAPSPRPGTHWRAAWGRLEECATTLAVNEARAISEIAVPIAAGRKAISLWAALFHWGSFI
jgi:hypothetical protein